MDEGEKEALQRTAEEAKVLHEAATILQKLTDEAHEMDADGHFGDDGADDLIERLQTAGEVCGQMSTIMTRELAKHGYVPDFGDDGDDTDDRTFH